MGIAFGRLCPVVGIGRSAEAGTTVGTAATRANACVAALGLAGTGTAGIATAAIAIWRPAVGTVGCTTSRAAARGGIGRLVACIAAAIATGIALTAVVIGAAAIR